LRNLNELKSCTVTFTLRKRTCPAVKLNHIPIPRVHTVRYLGLHFDAKLTWSHHIHTKREQMDLKAKEINWLIGRRSPLTYDNKVLIYNTVLKPIWTYGCELWGCASKTNIHIIQRFQSKILREMANAPWYVSNHTLHNDLKVPLVQDVITERKRNHRRKLANHTNPLLESLIRGHDTRRLQRVWPTDV
jgi:hypothetical protein